MNIILAGAGKIGSSLMKHLLFEGHNITVIDSDESNLDKIIERNDVFTICGNCATESVLSEAGVKDSDLLIVTTGEDEVNLLSCMIAHSLNSRIHTIARIRNPEYAEQVYKMRNLFNLSLTVNPEKQTAVEIERLIKYPGFLKRDTFAKGRVEIVEVKIDENSILKDHSLKSLERLVNCKILVCAVLRNGESIVPSGDFKLLENDRIFVTAPVDNLTKLLNSLKITTKKAKSVMICGGSRISYYLATSLCRNGFKVKIIDNNYAKCVSLANSLPDADIIYGDASDYNLLESEGLRDCDVLVTATGLDEMNIIISLYANSANIPQVITKISHYKDTAIINNLSVGSVVSPDELSCNTIIRYVRALKNQSGAAVAVHFIADKQVEAIEFRVDDSTNHCNEELHNIRLKDNILIACITHLGKTLIPDGSSSFSKGDTVIIVTKNDNPIYNLNDIFS